jgi:hypothetical protein
MEEFPILLEDKKEDGSTRSELSGVGDVNFSMFRLMWKPDCWTFKTKNMREL